MSEVPEDTVFCNIILYKMYKKHLSEHEVISYSEYLFYIRCLINREIECDIK